MSDSPTFAVSKDKIEFPLRLRSDLSEIVVAPDLHIRRMDDESRRKLLRIEDVEYDDAGRLKGYSRLPGCLINIQIGPVVDTFFEFCSSNYVLTACSPERAVEFNLALKLTGISCSSLYIGYKPNGSRYFLSPAGYFGDCPLMVTGTEKFTFSRLVDQISLLRRDQKLKVISDIYRQAFATELRQETRFIEMVVILEMLLLPAQSTELSFRFSLRLAKLMGNESGQSIDDVFKHARQIYASRSNLVHSGKDRALDSIAPTAYEYVRKLICMYLADSTQFDEARLEAMCLR